MFPGRGRAPSRSDRSR